MKLLVFCTIFSLRAWYICIIMNAWVKLQCRWWNLVARLAKTIQPPSLLIPTLYDCPASGHLHETHMSCHIFYTDPLTVQHIYNAHVKVGVRVFATSTGAEITHQPRAERWEWTATVLSFNAFLSYSQQIFLNTIFWNKNTTKRKGSAL